MRYSTEEGCAHNMCHVHVPCTIKHNNYNVSLLPLPKHAASIIKHLYWNDEVKSSKTSAALNKQLYLKYDVV